MGIEPGRNKSGRIYTWGEEEYTSVTTFLGAVAKPALPPWASKMAAQFVVENFATIADLMSRGEQRAVVDLVKGAPWRNRDAAADLGTLVHRAIEAVSSDTPVLATDAIGRHLVHFADFMATFQPKILESECTVFSRHWGYAGTLDLLVEMADLVWLIDVKSGSGVYPEAALQITAYSRADFIGRPDGTEDPLPPVDRGAVLHIRPTGYQLVPVRIDDEIFRAFAHIQEVFRWQSVLSPSAVSPVVRHPDALAQ